MAMLGSYRVGKEIATAGFGRIFEGEHVLLGKKVCLKQNLRQTPEDAALLRAEAGILWDLEDYHSIPTVKDFFELEKNNVVMVMSFIEGKTLEDLVEEHGRLHAEDACWITERLIGALYFAHSYGVVHSDVKPQNVIVEPKKRDIKLIDFGLASFHPKSGTRPLGFTEYYAAPELKEGKPPIPETDIYGAGTVLLRALGGNLHTQEFPADVSPRVVSFCQELLRYDPLQRPTWERDNPLQKLSDIRYEVFGRRHIK